MKDFSQAETILVPHDFTLVAEYAILHANNIARSVGLSVTVVHVVKNSRDRLAAKEKLEEIAKQNEEKSGILTKSVIAEGNYLSKIGEVAEMVNAGLAIMGTHGVKGVQKVIGSYALKVITQSDVPYIVVQEKPKENDKISNIVAPLDFSRESKQKLYLMLAIAKIFKSKIHIVADYESDEFTSVSMKNNIQYARNFLTDNELDHEIVELTHKNSGLVKETISYSLKVNADLIAVITSVEGKLSSLILGDSEQALVANKELIPVICMNPVGGLILTHGMVIAHGG